MTTIRQRLVGQFKEPRGPLGRLAGWVMAHRESNVRRNAWTVSLLDIEPHHKVLEVGCGPGRGLEYVAERLKDGCAVGLDHSALMVELATKRNARWVDTGRVRVVHAGAETAAELDQTFDRVFAVNVVQFWDAPAKTLRVLRNRMAPDGRIGIALQPRNRGASANDTHRNAKRIVTWLKEAGFENPRIEYLELSPPVTCVLADASSSPTRD